MNTRNIGTIFSSALKTIFAVPVFLIQELVRGIARVGDYVFTNLADIFSAFKIKTKDIEFPIPIVGDLMPFLFRKIAGGFKKIVHARGFPIFFSSPQSKQSVDREVHSNEVSQSIKRDIQPKDKINVEKGGYWEEKIIEAKGKEPEVAKLV